MRRWMFALFGAVLFGAATFFYGLIRFPNGLDWLTMQQFAIGLVMFGTTAGALLGLVAAWVSNPSVARRTRFLVIGVALMVATAVATTIVILYLQGSKNGDVFDGNVLATVLVSKRDVHANEPLDPLIDKGVIIEVQVPREALVVGALTDLRQLRGATAISLIRKSWQISADEVMRLNEPPAENTTPAPGSYRLVQAEHGRTWLIAVGEPRRMKFYGTWHITLGEPVTFPPEQLRPDDRFGCEPGTHSVKAPPLEDWVDERGVSNNRFDDLTVHTNQDGSVTVTCFAKGGKPELS